jgi:hypothetical protein
MPIDTTKMSKEEINRLRLWSVCAECGAMLAEYLDLKTKETYIACSRNEKHQGIAREYHPRTGFTIENIKKELGKKMTQEKANQLAIYAGVTSLTEVKAKEILTLMWPEAEKASAIEYSKAMLLCVQYGLNPVDNHIFLLPFWNRRRRAYDYVCVQGINATRLIASRRHKWSFLDDTPRMATDEEAKKHYLHLVDFEKYYYFVAKIRDMAILENGAWITLQHGAEIEGWAEWSINAKDSDGNEVAHKPHGTESGNSITNMGCIRCERNAIHKMYPADMPNINVPTVDSRFIKPGAPIIEGEYSVVNEPSTEVDGAAASPAAEKAEKLSPEEIEIRELKDQLAKAEAAYALIKDKKAGEAATTSTEGVNPADSQKSPPAAAVKSFIDVEWVIETLKEINWTRDNYKTFLSWLSSQPKLKGLDTTGKIEEVLGRLTREQAEVVANYLQTRQGPSDRLFED